MGVLISPIAPKAIVVDHIQLWAVVACKLPSPTKFGNHVNQYPISKYRKYCSVLGPWAFFRGRCRELLSYAVFVRPTVLPWGDVGIDWRRSCKKKTMPFPYHEGNCCLTLFRVGVALIRRIRHYVSVSMVQRRLVAVGYQSQRISRHILLTLELPTSLNVAAFWHTSTGLEPSPLISFDICCPGSSHRTGMAMPECSAVLLKGW